MPSEKWSDCPSYEGVPEYGGPCWTCQGIPEQCPLSIEDLGLNYLYRSHIAAEQMQTWFDENEEVWQAWDWL